MKTGRQTGNTLLPKNFSMAHRVGVSAILLSLFTSFFNITLAIVPLLIFLLLCFTAPFLPGVSFYLPIISRGESDKHAVAVTFDDGPNPESTPGLLNLLSKHCVKATFYVTGRQADKYPELIHQIVSLDHTIGNHSFSHDNFIMLKKADVLMEEIEKAQQVFQRIGVFPLTFRPPVGITNPKLEGVLKQLDMITVNFSRRPGDRGNRKVNHISRKVLKRLRSGDIIMLHDTPAKNNEMKQRWLHEVDQILTGIKRRHLKILPLAELIDRPIMKNVKPTNGEHEPQCCIKKVAKRGET